MAHSGARKAHGKKIICTVKHYYNLALYSNHGCFSFCRFANSANTVEVVINVLMVLITTAGYIFILLQKCSLRTRHEVLCNYKILGFLLRLTSIYYMAAVA